MNETDLTRELETKARDYLERRARPLVEEVLKQQAWDEFYNVTYPGLLNDLERKHGGAIDERQERQEFGRGWAEAYAGCRVRFNCEIWPKVIDALLPTYVRHFAKEAALSVIKKDIQAHIDKLYPGLPSLPADYLSPGLPPEPDITVSPNAVKSG